MSIKKTGKPLDQQLRDARKVMRSLPTYVGTEAVQFSKRSFKRQGFVDNGFEKWKARKGKQKGRRRSVMIKSGRLRRSIRLITKGSNYVIIGTDVPYAQIHNEGGHIKKTASIKSHSRKVNKAFGKRLKKPVTATIRPHKRKMNTRIPKRQFIGKSRFLNKRIEKNINHKLAVAMGATNR